MTSQPDSPVTDRMGIDEDEMQADQNPDLIIVAGEVLEEDADPDAIETDADGQDDLASGDLASGDLASGDLAPSDLATSDPTGSDPEEYATTGQPDLVASEDAGETDPSDGGSLGDSARPADLSQQWHDIQAMFVDDPRGSVDLAAAAADAAVSALVQTLQQRQSALTPTGSTSADPGGTEQLREALRSYRIFCQSLTEIGQRLEQPATMTQ
jgi:hypothetical protein